MKITDRTKRMKKNKLLRSKIFKRYPKLFAQKNNSIRETCMCWGIECGDGWLPLIHALCSQLQFDIDKNHYPQIEFTQIKEKFGTLRLYYETTQLNEKDERLEYKSGLQEGMISFAEQLSECICEHCGSNNDITQTDGWITTICKECLEERERNGKNSTL